MRASAARIAAVALVALTACADDGLAPIDAAPVRIDGANVTADAVPVDAPPPPAIDAAEAGADAAASAPDGAAPVVDAAAVVDAAPPPDGAAIADASPPVDAGPDASPLCDGLGAQGQVPSCSVCEAFGRDCDTLVIGGSTSRHCDCGGDSDCPCGLRCGSREIAPGIVVSGLCVR